MLSKASQEKLYHLWQLQRGLNIRRKTLFVTTIEKIGMEGKASGIIESKPHLPNRK